MMLASTGSRLGITCLKTLASRESRGQDLIGEFVISFRMSVSEIGLKSESA